MQLDVIRKACKLQVVHAQVDRVRSRDSERVLQEV